MAKRIVVCPYKMSSQGARELVKATDGIRVRQVGNYHGKPNDLVIYWGVSTPTNWKPINFLNNPRNIAIAINKKDAFARLLVAGVPIPPANVNKEVAKEWQKDGKIIVARKSLTSSAGRGIVVVKKGEEIPDALLYTAHIRHKQEYRVHVICGQVVDVAEKRKRAGFDGNDNLIRNYDKGWVFCHQNIDCPDVVKDVSLAAVKSLGLDFGAVDVGYRVGDGEAYVFEVNTAPGIEGQTITNYAKAIKEIAIA